MAKFLKPTSRMTDAVKCSVCGRYIDVIMVAIEDGEIVRYVMPHSCEKAKTTS